MPPEAFAAIGGVSLCRGERKTVGTRLQGSEYVRSRWKSYRWRRCRPPRDEMPASSARAHPSAACDAFGSGTRRSHPPETERPPRRCPGGFDSSCDLRRGGDVKEGCPGDAGLRDRIEDWLYGGAGGGASLSAT